jgi:hypothetical protein
MSTPPLVPATGFIGMLGQLAPLLVPGAAARPQPPPLPAATRSESPKPGLGTGRERLLVPPAPRPGEKRGRPAPRSIEECPPGPSFPSPATLVGPGWVAPMQAPGPAPWIPYTHSYKRHAGEEGGDPGEWAMGPYGPVPVRLLHYPGPMMATPGPTQPFWRLLPQGPLPVLLMGGSGVPAFGPPTVATGPVPAQPLPLPVHVHYSPSFVCHFCGAACDSQPSLLEHERRHAVDSEPEVPTATGSGSGNQEVHAGPDSDDVSKLDVNLALSGQRQLEALVQPPSIVVARLPLVIPAMAGGPGPGVSGSDGVSPDNHGTAQCMCVSLTASVSIVWLWHSQTNYPQVNHHDHAFKDNV